VQTEAFFDTGTSTFSYLVRDPASNRCVIIDSVLDYDPKSGRTRTTQADRLITRVREFGATVDWILETHAHADHLSAAAYLKTKLGGRTGIGEHITEVQEIFGGVFNAGAAFATDGSQFDHLFANGETFSSGSLTFAVMHTPGHTPACLSYCISDGEETVVFVGDTLFMPDVGTARCDFPGGDARTLYRSIRRILALPPGTRLFVGHDYKPEGRDEFGWEASVAEHRATNIHVRDGIGEDEFVALREARNRTLGPPRLILPSLQVNIRAGRLPPADPDGTIRLRIPLTLAG